MKRTMMALSLLLVAGLLIPPAGMADRRSGFATPDNFYVRSETHLKCRTQQFSYSSGDIAPCFDAGQPGFKFDLSYQSISLLGGSKGFIDIPRMGSRLVAPNDNTVIAITFSAMHLVQTVDDEPLFVRALVDGQEAEPGPVVFTAGFGSTRFSAQSFTFTTTVNSGIHIVQMQWSSESNSKISYLRNASLLVSVDSQNDASHRVAAKVGRLKEPVNKGDSSWTSIPQAALNFNVPEHGVAALTFSGVLKMNQGDFILVRAVIDDGAVVAVPVENTFAARSFHYGARSLTFTAGELKEGTHKVRFEWRSSATDVVASATLLSWSVTTITGPRETKSSAFGVVPQTMLATSTSPTFEPVPTLETEVRVEEVSDVAVTFSAAFAGPGVVIATVTADGVPVEVQETVVYAPVIMIDEKNTHHYWVNDAGGQSYTFSLKDLPARASPYRLGIAYRVVEAGVSTSPSGTVYNATMTVISKQRIGPDLAVGANMGAGSKKHEAVIEPIHGTRKVLAVIFDPGRKDAPKADRAFKAGIDRVLFGEAPSAADYYKVVSGGRFQLEKVAVLGPYAGDKTGEDPNHYWNRSLHDPDGDGDCADSTDPYCSPWEEQLAEALLKANDEIDFSQFDVDRDGVVSRHELGILVITPQYTSTGSETKMNFRPFTSGEQFEADGVILPSLMHWYTQGIGEEGEAVDGLDSAMIAVHEMAHLFLSLDDAYGRFEGIYDGNGTQACPEEDKSACQTRYVNTAPHPVSLMTYKTITSSPHLDGFHKLQLGWTTPRIIADAGEFDMLDVRQSAEVFILPRRGTDAREYLLLETRYHSDAVDDPGYDYGIGDQGLAVYHIIEPGLSCQAQEGATAANCAPLLKPMCITSDLVWESYVSNFLRGGLRLIQPDLVHRYKDAKTNFGETLWGVMFGMDLLDTPPGDAMVCPTNIGDELPVGGTPLLLWADGSASGYRLKEISLLADSKAVSFVTEIDGQ